MAVSYPLAFPSIGIQASSFRLQRIVAESSSPFTGAQQVYKHPGEWWEGEVTFRPTKRSEVAEIQAFLTQLRGKYGTFLYGDPDALALGTMGTPTLAGLSTNEVRNGDATGAVNGVIGSGGALPTNFTRASASGLAWEIIGSGTDSTTGLKYFDLKLSGTTSGTSISVRSESITQINAVAGETWTASLYAALVGGSFTNFNNAKSRCTGRDAAGALVESTESSDITLTSSLQRSSVSRTMAGGTVAKMTTDFILNFSSGVAVDATFRLGGFQAEEQAAATPYIPTSSVAVTRSNKVAVYGASQTGNELIVWGFGASLTDRLKAGDYIQLGTGASSTLHLVTVDADTDVSGKVALQIEPALRSSPANDATVTVTDPKCVMRLSDNAAEWNSDASSVYSVTIAFKEAL